jgi:PrtD family type I secretion system ABC transporter
MPRESLLGPLGSPKVDANIGSRVGRALWAAAGFSVVLNLLLLVPSLYMLQVYDRVLTSRSIETLLMLTVITTVCLAATSALDHVRSAITSFLGSMVENTLGSPAIEGMLEHSARGAAMDDGASRSLRDIATVKAFLASPALFALFDAPWVLIYSFVIFLFHPLLGLIALASAMILLGLAWVGERLTKRGIEKSIEASYRSTRFVESAQRSAEAIVAMRMTQGIADRWAALSAEAKGTQAQAAQVARIISGLTKFFRQFVQVAMLGAAAYVTVRQLATPGVMIAATVLLGRALAPAEMAIGAWRQFIEVRAAWDRLNTTFMRFGNRDANIELPEAQGRIDVEGLGYAPIPGAPPVLRNVSFRLEPGELLAVVGPSGSGKSTLARLLVGVTETVFGKVRMDGAELRSWNPAQLGKAIGYLPQDVELVAGTVAQNIARLGSRDDAATIAAATKANAHQMVLQLPMAYDTPVGEQSLHTLSGGQRQRIALARALYGNPKLVVLDEPNASLDQEGEAALHEALAGLKRAKVTTIVITQRRRALALADKFLVLKGGAVERYGTRQEIEGLVRDDRTRTTMNVQLPQGPA